MAKYLILAKTLNHEKFKEYMNGHIPTIKQYGGNVIYRSIENETILGNNSYDAIVLQEWKSKVEFNMWWDSKEYAQWKELRDLSAKIEIIQLQIDDE